MEDRKDTFIGFQAGQTELAVIEKVNRMLFEQTGRSNQSEAIRLLINAGAEKVLGK